MKFAVISDIHSNWQALEAVMADFPPIDPISTMRPRDRRSAGSSDWRTRTWPTTFTSSCRVSSSGGRNSSGAATAMPAFATRASSFPICSAASRTPSASVTSKTSSVVPSGASPALRTEA